VDRAIEPDQRDRRRHTRDRRRRRHDRRHYWPWLVPRGAAGRVLRWFTGPWNSANGVSWLRLLVLFLIVKWALVSVYSIPSSSMEPTLMGSRDFFTRDRVAVNKLAFGPRVPFSGRRIVPTGTPKRWDIVVFDSPAPSAEGRLLIKRIVGMPGERVRVTQGRLYINGKLVEPPPKIAASLSYTDALGVSNDTVDRLLLSFAKYRRTPADLPDASPTDLVQLRRDLQALHTKVRTTNLAGLNRVDARRLVAGVQSSSADIVRRWWADRLNQIGSPRYGVLQGPEFTLVPANNYYCLGDNGLESFDSRMFGWVARENLIGRAFAVVTPPARARDLSGFSSTPRGQFILYGAAALVIAWELIPGFIVFSWRLRGPVAALGLLRGDHLLVDRLTYGVRIPFTTRRFFWWRRPRPGDAICYRMSRRTALELYFGEVRHVELSPRMRVMVTGPESDAGDHASYALTAVDIIGRARFVWFPGRRRGRIRPHTPPLESTPGDAVN
jgi:signal peptidase I